MKKAGLAILAIILLSGCAVSQQRRLVDASELCNNPGINVISPDFQFVSSESEVENFYICMLGKIQIKDENPEDFASAFAAGYYGSNYAEQNINKAAQLDLEYQQVLWRQIFTRERTRNSAQEEWLKWVAQTQSARNLSSNVTAYKNRARRQTNSIQQRRVSPSNCTGVNIGGGVTSISCY